MPAGPLARLCSTVSFLQAAKFYYHFSTTDIDECTEGIDNCHQQAMCQNTDGSFNCYCNNGWTGNGTHCTGKEGINWVSHQRIPPIVDVLSWPLAYDKWSNLAKLQMECGVKETWTSDYQEILEITVSKIWLIIDVVWIF